MEAHVQNVASDEPIDLRDPYPMFARRRGEGGVFRGSVMDWSKTPDSLKPENLYAAVSFDAVNRVFRDGKVFNSTIYDATIGLFIGPSILAMEGPLHRAHRNLVTTAFKAKSLKRWEPEIVRPICERLIDEFIDTGRADLVRDFTFEFPTRVISTLLGLPEEDLAWFRARAVELISYHVKYKRAFEASAALKDYFLNQIELRRSAPTDDIIGDLVTAEVDGENAEAKDRRLPQVAQGERLTGDPIEATGHETSPPARYTEASIVAELERREIGRPSTYAPTISTIMDRGYVSKRGTALVPSWTAFAVIGLLEDYFAKYVDYDFTARMEDDLDRIAAGELGREAWLQTFYFGAPAAETEKGVEGLKHVVDNLGEIDARAVNSLPITEDITLRVGQYGPYLERSLPADAEAGATLPRANVPEDLAPDELTPAKAEELFATAQPSERELGTDPETGRTIVAKDGRYGPYVTEVIPEMTEEELQAWLDAQPTEYYKNGKPKPKKKPAKEKPRTGSLFTSMSVDTVTLEQALQLMSLPRVVGADAEGEVITAQNGRFGPYLKKGSDSRSLESEDQIFSITQEQALEIYAQPKQRGRGAAKPPLAEFGEDPVSGKKVTVKEGRFGPYITDGVTNITVPRGRQPEELTAEEAYQLLADKRAKGPATRGGAKKPAARKAPAKKTTARKKA